MKPQQLPNRKMFLSAKTKPPTKNFQKKPTIYSPKEQFTSGLFFLTFFTNMTWFLEIS
jgi:hypothetical protein